MVYQEYAQSEATPLVPGEISSYGPPGSIPAYGAPDDDIVSHKAYGLAKPRRGLNLVPACLSLLLPWILFLIIYAVTSFSVHYFAPFWCWFIVAIGALMVLACAAVTVYSAMKGRDPTWYGLLSTLMLIALVVAACLGTANFRQNIQPYYDSNNLNHYEDVDPGRVSAQQMMDAGQISFVNGVSPDVSKAMGFRSRHMYCVTPITRGAGTNPASGVYDFWAVGTNCCTGAANDFHCNEYDNRYAHSGIRLADQEEQAFYRLAVQQAEAAYNIKAPHPIFLKWMQDPNAELNSYADDGMMYYFVGIFSHLGFQVVVVAGAVLVLSKLA